MDPWEKRCKNKAHKSQKPISQTMKQSLSRIGHLMHLDSIECLIDFLAYKFRALLMPGASGMQAIYHLHCGSLTYIGRCAGIRQSRSNCSGF